jgi:hypothetical protein
VRPLSLRPAVRPGLEEGLTTIETPVSVVPAATS